MGTALEGSKVTYRQWAFAIYMCLTNLKGVSSMKLHRDLGVSQPTAWFMLHRIREAWGLRTRKRSRVRSRWMRRSLAGMEEESNTSNKKLKMRAVAPWARRL